MHFRLSTTKNFYPNSRTLNNKTHNLKKGIFLFTLLFPVWAILFCGIALLWEDSFAWFHSEWISISLGFIMLFMGMTIKPEDFQRVLKHPTPILLGVFLQYTIMPLSGLGVSLALNLSPEFAGGLILVASCPGGTASNVMCYLGKLDVALSVSMTLISTLLGVILTPFLTYFLIGNKVNVDTLGLLVSTAKVVLLPVVLGYLLSKYFQQIISKLEIYFPLFSVVLIVLIVASIVGASRKSILEFFNILALAVFLTHSLGFLLGYILGKWILKNESNAKTISIEVGMQNSGLGVALAKENFSNLLVAVPPALSSLFHSLIASILVGLWNLNKAKREKNS